MCPGTGIVKRRSGCGLYACRVRGCCSGRSHQRTGFSGETVGSRVHVDRSRGLLRRKHRTGLSRVGSGKSEASWSDGCFAARRGSRGTSGHRICAGLCGRSPLTTTRAARRLLDQLHDERSRQVVLVSHCLLNQNTRYAGGATRPGAVAEVVAELMSAGYGIHQLPWPRTVGVGRCAQTAQPVALSRVNRTAVSIAGHSLGWLHPTDNEDLPSSRAVRRR